MGEPDNKEIRRMITPFGSALRIGTITGFMIIFNIWYASRYAVDHPGETPEWIGFIPFIVLALGIFFAIQDHRKKFENGLILFKEAVGAGLITAFYISLLMALFIFLFNYLDEDTRTALQNQAKKGMSAQEIKVAEEMGKDMSPLARSIGTALFEFARWLMFGFMISFALGLITGKRKVVQKAKQV